MLRFKAEEEIYIKEIQEFCTIINLHDNPIQEIIKKTLFLKKILEESDSDSTHYKKSCIFDLLYIFKALFNKDKREFYFYYRSYLENYVRIILKLDDNNDTGVLKLFKEFKKTLENNFLYDYFEEEYTYSCNFVHSNIKAGIDIKTYYNEIINEKATADEMEKMLSRLNKVLKNSIDIIIEKDCKLIENSFYRKEELVSFLLEEDLKEKYKLQKKKA